MSISDNSLHSQVQTLPPALPLREFHLFPTLPAEIQLYTWDQAALLPNFVNYTMYTSNIEYKWTIVGSTSPLLVSSSLKLANEAGIFYTSLELPSIHSFLLTLVLICYLKVDLPCGTKREACQQSEGGTSCDRQRYGPFQQRERCHTR